MITERKRILALDYGDRRVGVALSDPLHILAHPLDTLAHDSSLMKRLCTFIAEYDVGLILVGMPYNLKGQKEKKAQEVEQFIQDLRKQTPVEITTWDERFTSVMAQNTMRAMGTSKKDRRSKGRIDTMAAAILLQSFLDSRKRSLSC